MKKINQFALILSCVWLTACVSTTPPETNKNQYQEAKMNFQKHNYPVAFQQLQAPADAGDADAQYALGYMYFYGKGVTENRSQAEYWFKKSAAQGNSGAQKALALINQKEASDIPASPQ